MNLMKNAKLVVLVFSFLFCMDSIVCSENAVPVLEIYNGTSIGLFNLWNLHNVSCGSSNSGDFFRSDEIDIYDPTSNCPQAMYIRMVPMDASIPTFVRFDISYRELQHILGSPISQSTNWGVHTYVSHVNTADGFELKITDPSNTTLFFGIMKPLSSNGVSYFADFNSGFDISGGVLPQSTIYHKIGIVALYNDLCTVPVRSPPNPAKCDEPPSVTTAVAMYYVVYGSDVSMVCNINSVLPIESVAWADTSGTVETFVVTEQILYHDYNITGATFNDSGNYFCNVTNVLGIIGSASITLNVTGDKPLVQITQSSLSLNTTDTATFLCTVTASPEVTSYYWTKSAAGVSTQIVPNTRITVGPLPSPALTITNLLTSDAGSYMCHAENALGHVASNGGITLTVTDTTGGLCPCSCEYKTKVDYWASHNVTNMTYDEIVVWLQPKLKELEKILTVDKTNISAILNKKKSAKDSRPSARNIGVFGIVMLSAIAVLIILSDMTSLSRHLSTVKQICFRSKKTP